MNTSSEAIWIVDDDASIRWVTETALRKANLLTRSFSDAVSCVDALRSGERPSLLITDIRMPGMDGHELMRILNTEHKGLPVIVVSAHSDVDSIVNAYRNGALETLAKPFDVQELVALVLRLSASREPVKETSASRDNSMIGSSPAMQQVFRVIGRLTKASMSVLITGESGSGKELVARTLHDNSPRRSQAFIAINTAAIPRELLESELFGHERGAFTGASGRRAGRFEQATGGTLFLDEIGDMPLDMQTRLLRVLSENEFYRVGGHETVHADVRVLAATHQDLSALVAAGRFREDLYHRLNVVQIAVPPLRERREDIPALVDRFLAEAANEMHTEPKRMTEDALSILQTRNWPGNVRELRNYCRRLTALAPEPMITADDLAVDGDMQSRPDATLEQLLRRRFQQSPNRMAVNILDELEKELLKAALEESAGHKQRAARRMGWGRNTLARKLKLHGLD